MATFLFMTDEDRKRRKAESQQRWYAKNKGRHIANVAARNARVRLGNRVRLVEYLAAHPCVDCGETDPVVLDFDHVRGEKRCDISHLLSRRHPWSTVEQEIAKCDVRCANCHRRKTAAEQGG